jgi:DNA-nicking Smr family endonuclease
MGMDDWLEKYPPSDKDEDRIDSNPIHISRRKLRKGPSQDRLDLHGLTAAEAAEAVEMFLYNSKKRGLKKVLIIHGKGNHSASGPVLKREVIRLLEKNPAAGEFGPASRNEGGSGAHWVILK